MLAVTDHDITDGISEAIAAANDAQITIVPGIEISVTWAHQTVHVLGLHIDPDNSRLQAGIRKLQEYRVWRAEEIDRKLEKFGISGALAGAMIKTPKFHGVGAASYIRVDHFKGISLAGVTNYESSRGLSIALVNVAKELHGVQLGLINYAGNNKFLKFFPIINTHLYD